MLPWIVTCRYDSYLEALYADMGVYLCTDHGVLDEQVPGVRDVGGVRPDDRRHLERTDDCLNPGSEYWGGGERREKRVCS